MIPALRSLERSAESGNFTLKPREAADVMATREQATPSEAAAPQAAHPNWLPALSRLSLGEIASLDRTDLEPSVAHLRRRVNRPLSTVAGSDGS
jgi:hypothetical protein